MMVGSERLSLAGCLFFGLAVLMLFVASSSNFFRVAQATNVNSHTMALDISPEGTPIMGNIYFKGGWSHAQFTTQDEEAYVWMNLTLDERMAITAQWLFPNGSIYEVDEETCDEGLRCVWFSIGIRDSTPAHILGKWKIEVFANATPLFTDEFFISQAPTYPWTTTFGTAGLVVIVISGPILLVFSRMKRPPPRLGFILSLVGGMMIAISGFFRGALGGEMYVYSYAFAMVIVIFGMIPAIFLGAAIPISALTRRRVLVLILSVISLFYFMYIYYIFMSDDPHLYILPFILAITGSLCGILSGLLIRRKA